MPLNALITLKTFEGLVKGNAVLHYGGYIVADKTSSTFPPPYVVKKEGGKRGIFVNWKTYENVARIDFLKGLRALFFD
jgi:hypothetical protein